MQMVKRMIGGFFLSLILLWLFAPKVELYYLLEKSLKEKNIIISNETITDTWYGLKIEEADIYLSGAKVAHATELTFNFFFLYSALRVNEVKMEASLANMAPKALNTLEAVYSVTNPLNISLIGQGSFGSLEGSVSLMERKVNILFPVAKDIKTIQKFLRKDKEKGWYYETNY